MAATQAYPYSTQPAPVARAQYPAYGPIKGAAFSSPNFMDDHQGQVSTQFDTQFPGFPGAEIDMTPTYNRQNEVDTQDFHKRIGVPSPVHLANVHQPVDSFVGSYRDFEFHQPGCYPNADSRVYAQRETVPWVPGPMAQGIDSATMLKPGVYPELTHADGFQDILIDAPRNLFWADNVFDQQTALTRNFNQTTDLRGDEPVKLQDPVALSGWGISQTTQGPFEVRNAVREIVY